MKKLVLIAVLFAASVSMAYAGNHDSNPCGNHGNNCNQPPTTGGNATGGQGGAGGQGGDGGAGVGLAIAGASSVAEAKANAAAIAAQQQGQQQGQGQAQGQAILGSGNSGGNKLEGNKTSTNVSVGGDKYEAAASGVFAAPIPTVAKSCRLYMFGGGTTVDGAVSGSIPLGNDQTCLSGNNLNNMLRINEQAPGKFSIDDMVAEACKVEGMETAAPCQKVASK